MKYEVARHPIARFVMAIALLLTLALTASEVRAERPLNMARVPMAFPEAMSNLQEIIKRHEYKVSRVQRVDIGLTKSGYTTDRYRVVFFGRASELAKVKQRAPELLNFLPLRIAIYAEGGETLLIAADPTEYLGFANDAETRALLTGWKKDMASILEAMRALN